MNYDHFEQLYEKQEHITPLQKYIQHAKYVCTTHNFWLVTLTTWITFVGTLILWTYGYLEIERWCWTWSVFAIVACLLAIAYHFKGGSGLVVLPIAVGCLIAIVCGSVLGFYNYDMYAIFPAFYDNARKYTNVVASEPSAAVADAGKLEFNPQTHVEVSKSVGYKRENGDMYCVAPIYDPGAQPRIEYWAAGVNCCSAKGDFSCDAAQNKEAGGGVVVFDNHGYFAPSTYPFYQMARAKAEAEYFLQSVAEPVYVRWVERDNLNYLHDHYRNKAFTFNCVLGVLFFFIFAAFSLITWQPQVFHGNEVSHLK